MGFINPLVWVPATIVGFPSGYRGTSSDTLTIVLHENKTIRCIYIKDVDNLYPGDWVIGATSDRCDYQITNVFGLKTENITKDKYFSRNAKYYTNLTYLKNKAYNFYINPYGTVFNDGLPRLNY